MSAPQPRHRAPGPIRSRCLHRAVLAAVVLGDFTGLAGIAALTHQAAGPGETVVITTLCALPAAFLIVWACEATTRMHVRRVLQGRRCRWSLHRIRCR